MALVGKLQQFNVFVDGVSYIGKVPELTLPKLATKTSPYRAGGMWASVSVDMGLDDDALDMEITLGGLVVELLKKMGLAQADGMQLRFAGGYQDAASGEVMECQIQTRGRLTGVDFGSAKVGDDTAHKYTLKNTYVKITIAGEVIYEIDALNFIYIVGGVDRSAAFRQILGIA